MKFRSLFELTAPQSTDASHTPFSPYWDRVFTEGNFPTQLVPGERYGVCIVVEQGNITSDKIITFVEERHTEFFFGGVAGIELLLRNEKFREKLPKTPVIVTDARPIFIQKSISPPQEEMHHVPGFYPMTSPGEPAWRVRMYERAGIWPRGFVHLLFSRF